MLCSMLLISGDISTDFMSRNIGLAGYCWFRGSRGWICTRPRESTKNAYDSCSSWKSIISLKNVSTFMSAQVTPWNLLRVKTGKHSEIISPVNKKRHANALETSGLSNINKALVSRSANFILTPRSHDTTGWIGCKTGWMFVYTMQPVIRVEYSLCMPRLGNQVTVCRGIRKLWHNSALSGIYLRSPDSKLNFGKEGRKWMWDI